MKELSAKRQQLFQALLAEKSRQSKKRTHTIEENALHCKKQNGQRLGQQKTQITILKYKITILHHREQSLFSNIYILEIMETGSPPYITETRLLQQAELTSANK